MSQVSKHAAYHTIAREEFPRLMDVARYTTRSSDFEEIIARTEEHFWNPEDPDYLDFALPWSSDQPILPLASIAELQTAVADRLDEGQRITFANTSTQWFLSNLLHGEQGALNLSAGLAEMFVDPGAQEYAANQTREEARHVHALTRYMVARYGGRVFPPGDTLASLLTTLVTTDVVHEKIVGMQMLVEGLAMGALASLHVKAADPLLRRLAQLVMTDEAFHHKFGKLWARAAMPDFSPAERDQVEDWAERCFLTLLFNLVNVDQKRLLYPLFGLDPAWVQGAMLEVFTDTRRRRLLRKPTDEFRTLVKTLLNAGIITDRTRETYAAWVDLEALVGEGDRMVGDEIAEHGIRFLKDVNAGKRRIIRKTSEARR